MPNNSTERARKFRATRDQISFAIDRGGRDLLNALAMREGIPAARVLQNALLNRANLPCMPPREALEELSHVATRDEAEAVIMRLQAQSEDWEKEPQEKPQETRYTVTVNPDEWTAILNLADLVTDALASMNHVIAESGIDAPGTDRIRLTLSLEDAARLRQITANLRPLAKKSL